MTAPRRPKVAPGDIVHPCGVQCSDCADIWLLRLWGLTYEQIEQRMGWPDTFARRHVGQHRPDDLGIPIPQHRKPESGASRRARQRSQEAAA